MLKTIQIGCICFFIITFVTNYNYTVMTRWQNRILTAFSHAGLFTLLVMVMKKLIFLISLIITFGCTSNNTEEPKTDEPKEKCPEGICTEEKYEFPDISGMTDWERPNIIEERKACLQIPDACLKILYTKGLLEICLKYPYLLDIIASNDYQRGFNSLVRQFNGYRELLQRPDLINAVIEKYAVFGAEVSAIQLQSDLDKGMFSYGHLVLVFIWAQDVVLENLSEAQKKILVLLSFENKEIINNNPDIFGDMHNKSRHFVYAKIAINDPAFEFESNEQKNAVLAFIQEPRSLNQQIADYIENYIYEKYKQ